jgi:hypothetical protein
MRKRMPIKLNNIRVCCSCGHSTTVMIVNAASNDGKCWLCGGVMRYAWRRRPGARWQHELQSESHGRRVQGEATLFPRHHQQGDAAVQANAVSRAPSGILIVFFATLAVVLFCVFLKYSERPRAADRIDDSGIGTKLSVLPLPGNPFVPGM